MGPRRKRLECACWMYFFLPASHDGGGNSSEDEARRERESRAGVEKSERCGRRRLEKRERTVAVSRTAGKWKERGRWTTSGTEHGAFQPYIAVISRLPPAVPSAHPAQPLKQGRSLVFVGRQEKALAGATLQYRTESATTRSAGLAAF